MNLSREAIMTALVDHLTAALIVPFTADTTAGSNVITNLSTVVGLAVGLPTFAPGVPFGTVIAEIDEGAGEATLSLPIEADGIGVAFKTGFLTVGRRLLMWDRVTSQPALFVRNIGDLYQYPNTVLPCVTMRAEAWIYSKAGSSPSAVPGIALNYLVDAIDRAISPVDTDPTTFRQTLGGRVSNCWIEGESMLDAGDQDGQAKAVIPIHILVP
jgi:hypothetical protein